METPKNMRMERWRPFFPRFIHTFDMSNRRIVSWCLCVWKRDWMANEWMKWKLIFMKSWQLRGSIFESHSTMKKITNKKARRFVVVYWNYEFYSRITFIDVASFIVKRSIGFTKYFSPFLNTQQHNNMNFFENFEGLIPAKLSNQIMELD